MKKLLLILGFIGSIYAETFVPKNVIDGKVLDYFHKILPTTIIKNIYTTPYPDTYALMMGDNVVYGNIHSSYLFAGSMFDIYSKHDITEVIRKMNVPKIDISKINVADAIVSKAKSNKKLIIFIDPDCPYCRQLVTQIYDKGIDKKSNIYYIFMPIASHQNSKSHTMNILCSKEPINTLKEYMINNKDNLTVRTDDCNIDAVLERTGVLVRSLSIDGTPTIITGNGELVLGSDIVAIEEYLKK